MIRCGNCTDRHATADEVRECYAITREQNDEADREMAAERGYERHLEDRGYEDARAQEAHDARGVGGWWNLPMAGAMWAADGHDTRA